MPASSAAPELSEESDHAMDTSDCRPATVPVATGIERTSSSDMDCDSPTGNQKKTPRRVKMVTLSSP